jgi:hypothetical protein
MWLAAAGDEGRAVVSRWLVVWRFRNLGIVLVCCLVGATLAVVISRGQSARVPKCQPAALGEQSVPNAIETALHQRCLRDVYGGDELAPGGRVHIFVANHGQRVIKAALVSIATPAAHFFSTVPNTWAALTHDVLEVSAVALKGGSGWNATECYPDPARSSVIVQAQGDLPAAGSRLHQRFPHTPIRVVKDHRRRRSDCLEPATPAPGSNTHPADTRGCAHPRGHALVAMRKSENVASGHEKQESGSLGRGRPRSCLFVN